MSADARLAYVQARLQARHGRRLQEAAWRSLEATPDLATYLQRARETTLAPWIRTLSPNAGAHEIERLLREAWRRETVIVARWVPVRWRPAIAWLATLADLEACVHLARGGAVRRWMVDDPVLSDLALADAKQRRDALADSPLGEVLAETEDDATPLERWLRAWAARWPPKADDSALRALARDTARLAASPSPEAEDADPVPPSRQRLGRRFLSTFRRRAGHMSAVFAYLGLVALDLERLRTGLAPRALFSSPAEGMA